MSRFWTNRKGKRGNRGRRTLSKTHRKILIDLFEPLMLETCTREELNISITMWEGIEVKLSPSLTYLYRKGHISAKGRWFQKTITWSFELINLGDDIIWRHSTSNKIEEVTPNSTDDEVEEVTPKPLSKVPIEIILKYLKKIKQIPELINISRNCAVTN